MAESSQNQPDPARTGRDIWLYPPEFAPDPADFPNLSNEVVTQAMTAAWETARSLCPHYENWDRYAAYIRLIFVTFLADYDGSQIDILAGDVIFGQDTSKLIKALFGETLYHHQMQREYRAAVLMISEKASARRHSELFRRYVDSLARSPKAWFRARDGDGIFRIIIFGALACGNFDDVQFSEEQVQLLCEISVTQYDAIAFYKHRAEGETHNTFAYLDPSHRDEAFRRAREVLWALDTAWAKSPAHLAAASAVRYTGGPIHITMRRYRFVEDGLMVGKPDSEELVTTIRQNTHNKIWHRIDENIKPDNQSQARYLTILEQREKLLYDGLAELLEENEPHCRDCSYRQSYSSKEVYQFGGVKLCGRCKDEWRVYVESLPKRAVKLFPALATTAFGLAIAANSSLPGK
ncbi:putative aba 3 protein [Cladorrhinum sp. PSN332]|nr:putative aba 3 protein [Cladorrhinum sp. PSN332]